MSHNLSDYTEVPERIRMFFDKYPEGSLVSASPPEVLTVEGVDGKTGEVVKRTFIKYVAAAYRSPDDPRPGVGTAWEPFPGPTQFTRDSELMNAETSAWGRALVALGFVAKKIASAEEVRNRSTGRAGEMRAPDSAATDKQMAALKRRADDTKLWAAHFGIDLQAGVTKAQASQLLDALKSGPAPIGGSDVPSDVPPAPAAPEPVAEIA